MLLLAGLLPSAPSLAEGAPVDAAVLAEYELDSWTSAKDINTVEAYEVYLAEYANGRHAKFARAAINKIKKSESVLEVGVSDAHADKKAEEPAAKPVAVPATPLAAPVTAPQAKVEVAASEAAAAQSAIPPQKSLPDTTENKTVTPAPAPAADTASPISKENPAAR